MAAGLQRFRKPAYLATVLDKQKNLQECMVKFNPNITNVSMSVLKWSMTESNLSMYDAFSSWSDLDHALVQLNQVIIDQNISYRQTFKNIQAEEKRLAEIQRDKDNCTSKVNALVKKLEKANKEKKIDHVKIDNLESDLMLATGNEKQTSGILDVKKTEFESYKGNSLKGALSDIGNGYIDYLEKSLQIWKVKVEIAQSMAEKPVYHGGNLKTDSTIKVANLYQDLDMTLPVRDETTNMKKRSLPAEPPKKTSDRNQTSWSSSSNKSSDPKDSPSHQQQQGYEWKVPLSPHDSSDGEDYSFPDQIPDQRGEEYLRPGPKPGPKPGKHPPSPGSRKLRRHEEEDEEDYMGVIDDDESTPAASNRWNDSHDEVPSLPPTRPPPVPPETFNRSKMYSKEATQNGTGRTSADVPCREGKRPAHKKPGILPKPRTRPRSSSATARTIEDPATTEAGEDHHEYSDVAVEDNRGEDGRSSPEDYNYDYEAVGIGTRGNVLRQT